MMAGCRAVERMESVSTKGPCRVAVLMGGRSAERAVSLKSGHAVCEALHRRGYHVVAIDVDALIADRLTAEKADLVFLALHGPGGEDGTIQGLLEILGLPYTGSGVRASAIAIHKGYTRAFLSHRRVPVPKGVVLPREHRCERPPSGLRPPVVVKPACQGSTVGVTIVRRLKDWRPALEEAFSYDSEVVVESYIAGREITVSVLDGIALPPVEVRAPRGFYNYAAKYEQGGTRYFCPAPLAPSIQRHIQRLAVRSFRALGCDGAARVDFRMARSGQAYVLEVNTTPGMTDASLLPMAAAKVGIDYETLTERILSSAVRRKERTTSRRFP